SQRKQALPSDNASPPLFRHTLERRHEIGNVSQRVHDKQQRKSSGKHVHVISYVGAVSFPVQEEENFKLQTSNIKKNSKPQTSSYAPRERLRWGLSLEASLKFDVWSLKFEV